VDSKADQLNLAHETKTNKRLCPLNKRHNEVNKIRCTRQ